METQQPGGFQTFNQKLDVAVTGFHYETMPVLPIVRTDTGYGTISLFGVVAMVLLVLFGPGVAAAFVPFGLAGTHTGGGLSPLQIVVLAGAAMALWQRHQSWKALTAGVPVNPFSRGRSRLSPFLGNIRNSQGEPYFTEAFIQRWLDPLALLAAGWLLVEFGICGGLGPFLMLSGFCLRAVEEYVYRQSLKEFVQGAHVRWKAGVDAGISQPFQGRPTQQGRGFEKSAETGIPTGPPKENATAGSAGAAASSARPDGMGLGSLAPMSLSKNVKRGLLILAALLVAISLGGRVMHSLRPSHARGVEERTARPAALPIQPSTSPHPSPFPKQSAPGASQPQADLPTLPPLPSVAGSWTGTDNYPGQKSRRHSMTLEQLPDGSLRGVDVVFENENLWAKINIHGEVTPLPDAKVVLEHGDIVGGAWVNRGACWVQKFALTIAEDGASMSGRMRTDDAACNATLEASLHPEGGLITLRKVAAAPIADRMPVPVMPVSDTWVTSPYEKGRVHPVLLYRRDHTGVDLHAPENFPIKSVGDGRVTFCGRAGEYGNLVIIDHGNGLRSGYAHLSRILVRQGDNVRCGSEIARAGATGLARGFHLHYFLLWNGRPINPASICHFWECSSCGCFDWQKKPAPKPKPKLPLLRTV